MPNKDGGKGVTFAVLADNPGSCVAVAGRVGDKMGKAVGIKNSSAKVTWKGVDALGNGASPESHTEELLGSVTSGGVEGAVRTSARVIKKMKLDSAPTPEAASAAQQKKDPSREGDKPEEAAGDKQPPKLTKCRTPKALWSSTEKNLFFEALNEYGKDFDSITAYICNKMKRKGIPDSSTKAKHQVSTFYYRTWQKVSKYMKFDDSIKKVVQELYALINYGEMRKRMEGRVCGSKVCGRLGELVQRGVVAVRWRGRTLRVRTPVCRALRTLNQLHEWEEQLRLPVRVVVQLCARDSEAWCTVQGTAHNPRVLAPAPPSLRLQLLLHLLQKRWTIPSTKDVIPDLHQKNSLSCLNLLDCQVNALLNPSTQTTLRFDSSFEQISNGLNYTTDRISEPSGCKSEEGGEETKKNNNNVPNCINGNDLLKEDLSHKTVNKRLDGSDCKNDVKNETIPVHKDKQYLHVGPKPGLTFSLPTVSVGEHLTSQRICFNSYQERLRNNSLLSGLQNGAGFKGGGRFKNQKRSRKDSGEIEGLREGKKVKNENDNCDINKPDLFDIDETANDGMDIMDFRMIDDDDKEKDFLSELEDDGECEGDNNKNKDEANQENNTSSNKIKVPEKTRKESQKFVPPSIPDSPEDGKTVTLTTSTPALVPPNSANSVIGLKAWNKEVLLQQVKKGWSVMDAGDLSIGDLYLMFGSDSKLELEYWWCEPSPPMQQRYKQPLPMEPAAAPGDTDGVCATNLPSKLECDKVEGGESEKDNMVDALLMSPTHTSQDSNDTEKEMLSPDHRQTHTSEEPAANGFPLVSKIINSVVHHSPPGDSKSPEHRDLAPMVVPSRERVVNISARLKKLLSLAKLYDAKGTKTGCSCGHFCASSRLKFRSQPILREDASSRTTTEYPWQRGNISNPQEGIHFRTPLPKIAMRPNPVVRTTELGLDKLPPWTKRGSRPKVHNVPPQRFTILPRPIIQSVTPVVKTTQVSVASTSSSNTSTSALKVLPKLKPKPCVVTVRPSLTVDRNQNAEGGSSVKLSDVKSQNSPTETAKIVGSSDNQFMTASKTIEGSKWSEAMKQETVDATPNLANLLDISLPSNICDDNSIGITFKTNKHDPVANFTGLLPAESMSMSPSRLLKENDDQWFESDVHNFSLSSFLNHLEGPQGTNSSVSKMGKPDDESNMVGAPLHCLMNDSVDYMAKFEDLANRVSAEATK